MEPNVKDLSSARYFMVRNSYTGTSNRESIDVSVQKNIYFQKGADKLSLFFLYPSFIFNDWSPFNLGI